MTPDPTQAFRELIRAIIREELASAVAPVAPTSGNPAPVPGAPVDEYIDDRALAAWIGLSRETLQQMRASGADGPPWIKVAKRAVRYHVPAVRKWLSSQQRGR